MAPQSLSSIFRPRSGSQTFADTVAFPQSSTLQHVPLECAGLRRLMYISTATNPEMCTPEFLRELSEQSSASNQRAGVSGFLFYSAPFFFQVLEGQGDAIGGLYEKIAQDLRHRDLRVLVDLECEHRFYENWKMNMAHMDAITMHPAIKMVLQQITTSFTAMWTYLPRSAATILLQGRDPNKQRPESVDVVVTFVHIAEFPAIVRHTDLAQHLADLLQTFVDVCVRNVEASGGHIAKFINGMCMAYWRASAAAEAVRAVGQIVQDCADQRADGTSVNSLLHVRAGMHYGEALLCNAGTRKADFTLLGDSINTCARVTALTSKLGVALLISSNVHRLLPTSLATPMRSMGSHKVAGRVRPVECYGMAGCLLDSPELQARIQSFDNIQTTSFICRCVVQCYELLPPDQLPPIFNDRPPPEPAQRTVLVATGSRQNLLRRIVLSANAASELGVPTSPLSNPSTAPTDNTIVSLTYISHSVAAMGPEDFSAIKRVSVRNNQVDGIMGSLLYVYGLLVQTFEGPKSSVLAAYERIRRDKRHIDVVLVRLAPMETRLCSCPLEVTIVDEHLLSAFPPLHDLLAQLSRCYISLGHYVPSVVSRHLIAGKELRDLQPVLVDVVMLASDICSFTSLSEILSLTDVWRVCTTFIDGCTAAISRHGGDVIKLIGDCVTAYFPPSASYDALEAAKEIFNHVARLRQDYEGLDDSRSLIACGVGLDFGTVLMAQCGSLGVREFTVTGEVTARVLEVEALSRAAERAIVATGAYLDLIPCARGDFDRLINPVAEEICYGLRGAEWELDVGAVVRAIHHYSYPLDFAFPESANGDSQSMQDKALTPRLARIRRPTVAFDMKNRAAAAVGTPAPPSAADAPHWGVLTRWGACPGENLSVENLSPKPSRCGSDKVATRPRPWWCCCG